MTDKIVSDDVKVVKREDHRCAYCGGNADTIDHIIPQFQDGSHNPDNLAWACRPCNSRKGARTPEEAGMILTMYPESAVSEPYPAGYKRGYAIPPIDPEYRQNEAIPATIVHRVIDPRSESDPGYYARLSEVAGMNRLVNAYMLISPADRQRVNCFINRVLEDEYAANIDEVQ